MNSKTYRRQAIEDAIFAGTIIVISTTTLVFIFLHAFLPKY